MLAQWLPHIFILSILGMALLLMIWVMKPLLPVLMVAAALSALTYPVTTGPVHIWFDGRFPKLQDSTKRRISGITAMIVIILAILVPCLMSVAMMIGATHLNEDLVVGMLSKNLTQVEILLNQVTKQFMVIKELYPQIPFEPHMVKMYLMDMLKELLDLQPALLSFFFKGTGSLMIQVILCIIAMVFFYAEGGVLTRGVLHYTPLSREHADQLIETFRNVILRFLIDTMGVAVIKGTFLGLIVGFFLGLNPVVIIFFASFICLLPLVGTTLIWLPAATLLYKKGLWFDAFMIVVLAQASIFATHHVIAKVGAKLHEHSATTSFFIFISVIGGIVSFGVKGIVLGPMAVILVMVLGRYWRNYYQDSAMDIYP
jgi:predicted PurR-regulated permease PerM